MNAGCRRKRNGLVLAVVAGTVILATAHTLAFSGEPAPVVECKLSEPEKRLAELLVRHPEQQRKVLRCDPHLQEFAESRARDMAERNYFSHITPAPERSGPNQLLRETGYELPEYYVNGIANSIESIFAGVERVERVWQGFLESPVHRAHLLGLEPTYAKQERFAVAYLHQPESKYAHYWVVIITENGKADRKMTCTPPPTVCIAH